MTFLEKIYKVIKSNFHIMFIFILLVGTIILFIIGFILITIDLISKKRHESRQYHEKFPKLTSYSVVSVLLALILLVFVSIASY